jgi:hypothetical protein
MKKLFIEQLEMVKLFVKQRMPEFILFDRNYMLCVHYITSIRFIIISEEHILKK